MSHLFAILLALAGFTLIALSMGRHQVDIVGRRLGAVASKGARLGGYALLMLALLLDLVAFGAGYGGVAWFGQLSISAWSVVVWLCVRTHRRANYAPRTGSRKIHDTKN